MELFKIAEIKVTDFYRNKYQYKHCLVLPKEYTTFAVSHYNYLNFFWVFQSCIYNWDTIVCNM